MSGTVSYELFASIIGNSGNGFTSEGGTYQTFVNNTGTSVKGTIVVASRTVYNGVDIAPAQTKMPIGVIYESGVANGSNVKVVTYGKAEVLLEDGKSSTMGWWAAVSDNDDGRMYQETTPNASEHYQEIGHSLESKSSGTDVLSLVQLHFN